MKIKAVLFDLDGTLLPMDQDVFVKAYLGGLAELLSPLGYAPKAIGEALWKSTSAMINNDGKKTNEQMFFDSFCSILGDGIRDCNHILENFYKTDFQKIQKVCGYTPLARKTVYRLHENGVKVALATNPLFPAIATESRIRWAGLEPCDFEFVTTYENSSFCKPNPEYYRDALSRLGLCAEECVMVGNDVDDDMVAEKLGMKVFLLTDCLINKGNQDISVYPKGSFDELNRFFDDILN